MRLANICVLASAALLITPIAMAEPAAPPGAAKPEAVTAPEAEKPDVATLLFGAPQWAKAPAGSKITYAYSKKTSEPAFGAAFEDRIILSLGKGDDADSRTAEVKMFSGVNAKPAGPFPSDKQNPVLLLVFEENVQEMSKIFKGNPRYLKNAIRKAWRDDAKIEPVSVSVDGKSMPGTRIAVQPFANDPEKDKMMGLEGMTYVVEIADGVPGQIASIDIRAPADGAPKFSETLRYMSEKTP